MTKRQEVAVVKGIEKPVGLSLWYGCLVRFFLVLYRMHLEENSRNVGAAITSRPNSKRKKFTLIPYSYVLTSRTAIALAISIHASNYHKPHHSLCEYYPNTPRTNSYTPIQFQFIVGDLKNPIIP